MVRGQGIGTWLGGFFGTSSGSHPRNSSGWLSLCHAQTVYVHIYMYIYIHIIDICIYIYTYTGIHVQVIYTQFCLVSGHSTQGGCRNGGEKSEHQKSRNPKP